MNRSVLALVLSSVLMSSFAQIILKAGMSSADVLTASGGDRWGLARAVAFNPWVLAGLALYFASAVVWLFVLAKLDVSLAYPFVGLGFVVTMLLARLVHGEALTPTRIAATLLIAAGVLLLARS